jgi:hypothetical protein
MPDKDSCSGVLATFGGLLPRFIISPHRMSAQEDQAIQSKGGLLLETQMNSMLGGSLE